MKLEVFRRNKKYIARLISYNEDNPNEKTKIIQEDTIPKLTIKIQDWLFAEFETKNTNNFDE